MLQGLLQFKRYGFELFLPKYRRADALLGRLITVQVDSSQSKGIVEGINGKGELILTQEDGGIKHCSAGKVFLRNGEVI